MIKLTPNSFMVQKIEELPRFKGSKRLYLDVETTSFDPKKKAFYPYSGARICGIAVTVDDCKDAYYIPIRHSDKRWNIPLEAVLAWLKELLATCEVWVNHNLKFDAHFCWVDGAEFLGDWVDTYPKSVMFNTDRFTHKLKPLCRELGLPMEEAQRVTAYLKAIKSEDYGDVPADILGEYACMDVLGNRVLDLHMDANWPEEMNGVKQTEMLLTPVLFDMERKGFGSHVMKLKVEKARALKRMIELTDVIHEISQKEFTNSNKWMFDTLVNQMGLPVLAYKKKKKKKDAFWDDGEQGSPTFDKAALKMYAIHPAVTADETKKKLIESVIEYRTHSQFKGLFLDTYLELMDNDCRLHPNYNQVVRTGRMSCSKPNAQQLNKKAKALIFPAEGNGFLSCDASQVEFRLIVHYINDLAAVKAYNEDKTIDFHQWVADLCEIKRGAGKTLNFGMAFGAGKRTVTANLSKDPDIIEHIGEQVNAEIAAGEIPASKKNARYLELCMKHATKVYNLYHERLPGLKLVAERAKDACKARGFVFNAFGRRRHLPAMFARKAFNSVIQGSAMDFIKTRIVALAPRYNPYMRELGMEIVANVHDEILFEGPKDVVQSKEVQAYILGVLETSPIPFRVPLTWDMGLGLNSWAEAVSDEAEIDRESLFDAEEEFDED